MHLDITSDDYHLGVDLNDGVRCRLIRHFTAFLKCKIAERGFTPDDPLLFDQDQIEDKAWWLMDRVIQEVQERVADELADAASAERFDLIDPAERIREHIAEQVPVQEREYLEDPLGGLDVLIQLASGHFPEFR